jgi:hypothetical protein
MILCEGDPGQSCVHLYARILSSSLTSVSIFSVCCYYGTLVEDKMRRFKGECEHFRFNKCPIHTHDGASAKFSTNSQEMDNSVLSLPRFFILLLLRLLNLKLRRFTVFTS